MKREPLGQRLMRRLGYVRWNRVIQGEIRWRLGEQTFVDLVTPGGQRVCGHIEEPYRKFMVSDNPTLHPEPM